MLQKVTGKNFTLQPQQQSIINRLFDEMLKKIGIFTGLIPWILMIITAIIPDTEILFGFDILAKTYE